MRRFPKASDVRATAPIARTSQRESPIIIPKAHHAHDTPLRGELICRRARKVNAGQYRIAGRRHFRESAGALRGGMDGRLRLRCNGRRRNAAAGDALHPHDAGVRTQQR